MARIPPSVIQEIRERTNIVEVIGRHVELKAKGQNYFGLCPFHQESHASFSVSPQKNIYYCFGCGASGDVFSFLQEIEGLDFTTAVRELAQAAGVEIPQHDLSPEEHAKIEHRNTLFEVLDAAASLYEAALWTSSDAAAARAYLKTRHLSPETLKRFRLGWAPSDWTSTLDALRKQGFSDAIVLKAGLAKQHESGRTYDTFRARVMIPIRDDRGRVIAFGGRILEGDGPKYINSPESDLYHKTHTLFGLDTARSAIGRKGRALLVEGYFDVITLQQAGIEETIAVCGTALTTRHVERLRNLTSRILMLTDSDEAGARAAQRALPLLEDARLASFRPRLPDAKDPDEFVRTHGVEAFEALLAQPESLLAAVTRTIAAQHPLTPRGQEAARDEIAALLHGGLTNAQGREIAQVLQIDDQEFLAWIRTHPPTKRAEAGPTDGPRPTPTWRPTALDTHLLWLAVHGNTTVHGRLKAIHPALIEPILRAPLSQLLSGTPVAEVLMTTNEPTLHRTLSAVILKEGLYRDNAAIIAVGHLAAQLITPRIQAQTAALNRDIEQAFSTANREQLTAATQKRDAWDSLQAAQTHARFALDALTPHEQAENTALVLAKTDALLASIAQIMEAFRSTSHIDNS